MSPRPPSMPIAKGRQGRFQLGKLAMNVGNDVVQTDLQYLKCSEKQAGLAMIYCNLCSG